MVVHSLAGAENLSAWFVRTCVPYALVSSAGKSFTVGNDWHLATWVEHDQLPWLRLNQGG